MISLYLDPQGEKIFTKTTAPPSNSHGMTNNSIDNRESPEETIINLRQKVKELEGKLSHFEVIRFKMATIIIIIIILFRWIFLRS